MTFRRFFGIVSIVLAVAFPTTASAWTLFGNLRCRHDDCRYYNLNNYPYFVGYQDLDNYPYTYKLPWNRCFNYCTCYPRPCFKGCYRK